MMNVLIIGSDGYIGSRLKQVLVHDHQITGVDSGWFHQNETTVSLDYRNLTSDELEKFDAIVLLAGHSSVKSCDGPIRSPWLNNVKNFTDLLTKTRNDQAIIYASSASVYGNSGPDGLHTEESSEFTPVNNYDVTKYVLDLHADRALQQGRKIIGLRFGTVCGWSPVLRTDVVINSMYETARITNSISVTNSHTSRAILGMEDLCAAINCCLTTPISGIYNLASFNVTIGEIATTMAEILNIGVVNNELAQSSHVYDFRLSTELFQQTYNFTFKENLNSIVRSLEKNYNHLKKKQRRDCYIEYDWNINEHR